MSDARERVEASLGDLARRHSERSAAEHVASSAAPPDDNVAELLGVFAARMPHGAMIDVREFRLETRVESFGPLGLRSRTVEVTEPSMVSRAWLLASGDRVLLSQGSGWSDDAYGHVSLLVRQDATPLFAVVPEHQRVALLNPRLPHPDGVSLGQLRGASIRSAIYEGLRLTQSTLPGATVYLHDYGNGISPVQQRWHVADFPGAMLQWLTSKVAEVLYAHGVR